jgi:hypothetical protein
MATNAGFCFVLFYLDFHLDFFLCFLCASAIALPHVDDLVCVHAHASLLGVVGESTDAIQFGIAVVDMLMIYHRKKSNRTAMEKLALSRPLLLQAEGPRSLGAILFLAVVSESTERKGMNFCDAEA